VFVSVVVRYTAANNQKIWGFELGNEINNQGGPPCNLTAESQARAMLTFAAMVRKAQPAAVMIGPDTGYRDWQAWLTASVDTFWHASSPLDSTSALLFSFVAMYV
jgi:hypothetical protein